MQVYAILVMIFFMILASYVGEVLISILYFNEENRIFHEYVFIYQGTTSRSLTISWPSKMWVLK